MSIRNAFKEKGYVLINVLLILMIISLIASISIKIVINNKFHESLEYKKGDLYNLENFEKMLCLLNKYSKENKGVVDEIKSKNIEKDIMEGMNLGYKKELDKFRLIYIDKGFRYETLLRYREVDGVVVFLPLEEKYIGKDNRS